jgi:ribonucleoside-diphosphate reductase alpha chain
MDDDKIQPKKRPAVLYGRTRRLKSGCGNVYLTVNWEDDKVFEIFLRLGKAGGCAACLMDVVGMGMSHALRSGMDVNEVVKTCKGQRCHSPEKIEGEDVLSCMDAIGQMLEIEIAAGSPRERMVVKDGQV